MCSSHLHFQHLKMVKGVWTWGWNGIGRAQVMAGSSGHSFKEWCGQGWWSMLYFHDRIFNSFKALITLGFEKQRIYSHHVLLNAAHPEWDPGVDPSDPSARTGGGAGLASVSVLDWIHVRTRWEFHSCWGFQEEEIRVPHQLLDFPVAQELENSLCNSGKHPAQFWCRNLPCGLEFFHTSGHKPYLPSSGMISADEKLWKRTGYYHCLVFFILVFLYLMETIALLPENMKIYRMNRSNFIPCPIVENSQKSLQKFQYFPPALCLCIRR